MKKGSIALFGAAFLAATLAGCNDDAKTKSLFACEDQEHIASVIERERGADHVSSVGMYFVNYINRYGTQRQQQQNTVYTRVATEQTPAEIDVMKQQAKAYCADGTIPGVKRDPAPN